MAHARHWGAPGLLSRALRTLAMTVDDAERLARSRRRPPCSRARPRGWRGRRRSQTSASSCAAPGAASTRARRCARRSSWRGAAAPTGLARRAFDELAATGEKVRTYTPIGVESLTPSQRRVAELAAGGLTNRQIAQTLFLTVKTIEAHLAAAYDKLGIRSRQELPGALSERAATGDLSGAAAGGASPGPI